MTFGLFHEKIKFPQFSPLCLQGHCNTEVIPSHSYTVENNLVGAFIQTISQEPGALMENGWNQHLATYYGNFWGLKNPAVFFNRVCTIKGEWRAENFSVGESRTTCALLLPEYEPDTTST